MTTKYHHVKTQLDKLTSFRPAIYNIKVILFFVNFIKSSGDCEDLKGLERKFNKIS